MLQLKADTEVAAALIRGSNEKRNAQKLREERDHESAKEKLFTEGLNPYKVRGRVRGKVGVRVRVRDTVSARVEAGAVIWAELWLMMFLYPRLYVWSLRAYSG